MAYFLSLFNQHIMLNCKKALRRLNLQQSSEYHIKVELFNII